MKVLALIITLCGVASCQFTCPENPDREYECLEGNYPNVNDCRKFWQCDTACYFYEQTCPANLHFSPEVLVCLNPADANCEEIATTTTTTVTTTTQTTTTSPGGTTTSSATTTQGTTTTSGPQVPVNPSIFYVARTSILFLSQDPVPFQAVISDRHKDYDVTSHSFTAPNDGLYFFMLTAGYRGGQAANYRMEHSVGPSTIVNVRRRGSSHNGIDTGSRDVIYNMAAGDQLRMTQFNPSGRLHSSNQGLETSWGGFSLHNSMETVSAFSVGRESSTSSVGVVAFDTVLVNTGEWNGQAYVAPQDGSYYFALSVAVDAAETVDVGLTVNSVGVARLYKTSTANDDIVTFSRTLFINLNQGDSVRYELYSGDIYSNDKLQTSFSGFFLKPRYTPRVGWSVHRTSSWSGTSNLDPVVFTDVLVNEGSVFSSSSQSITVPYTGFYYLYLGAGAQSGQPVEISVIDFDDTELIRLTREATNHNGVDTLSRAAIWYFNGGEQIRVIAKANTAFYGDSSMRLTSFQGFLIYSNQ